MALTKFESQGPGSPMNGLVTANGFFPLGAGSPQGTDAPFCEDFNQALVCGATTNNNACNRMPGNPGLFSADGGTLGSDAAAGVLLPGDPSSDPTQATTSTVCGNGIVESYEECDPATPFTCDNGAPCGPGAPCASGSLCTQSRSWHCSVPGALSCSATCRC